MRIIDLTGMILKGRYCILEHIGEGGEGHLYLARDMELGSLWAVKEIPISQKKEAKLLRLVEHPYMPKMIDYVEKEDCCYLVMEYIRGKSLGQWMAEGRQFSLEEVLDFGISAARAMGYLHGRKPPIFYGDLKPDNLMLTPEGKVYLVDFGSAVMGYADSQRECRGTRGFAAPEQYEGKMNAASDVYSLGKTLWVLLGKNRWKWFVRTPKFLAVLIKCCRSQEKKRYSDMKAVEAALEEIRQKGRNNRAELVFVIVFTAVFLLAAGGILLKKEERPDFYQRLGQVTGRYYEADFLEGTKEEQKRICKDVEEELQILMKQFFRKEEQCHLLLLLAANGEYREDYDRAELYYEQLLLYNPKCVEGYGEYGLFLWRMGKLEESRKLWLDYEKCGLEAEEGESSRNIQLWEERINEGDKKAKEK